MNTKEHFVVTIGREVGSGGHTVGCLLAKKLDVRVYDKVLVESLERQFNLSVSEIEQLKSKKKNWLADFISKVSPMPTAEALGVDPKYAQEFWRNVNTDDIFKAEVEILRGFAQMGSCVITGRSGFFIFRDHPNRLNVFITASMPNRLERVMRKQQLSEESAQALIDGIDKARENYIQRYAGVSRYDLRNYDLVLKSDGHSEEELADYIYSYIQSYR